MAEAVNTDLYEGSLAVRTLEDGRVVVLYPMIYTTRLCIGPAESPCYDDAWCYPDVGTGLLAFATWDGEGDPPEGWTRHPASGRRRPDGDPAQEYVMA